MDTSFWWNLYGWILCVCFLTMLINIIDFMDIVFLMPFFKVVVFGMKASGDTHETTPPIFHMTTSHAKKITEAKNKVNLLNKLSVHQMNSVNFNLIIQICADRTGKIFCFYDWIIEVKCSIFYCKNMLISFIKSALVCNVTFNIRS